MVKISSCLGNIEKFINKNKTILLIICIVILLIIIIVKWRKNRIEGMDNKNLICKIQGGKWNPDANGGEGECTLKKDEDKDEEEKEDKKNVVNCKTHCCKETACDYGAKCISYKADPYYCKTIFGECKSNTNIKRVTLDNHKNQISTVRTYDNGVNVRRIPCQCNFNYKQEKDNKCTELFNSKGIKNNSVEYPTQKEEDTANNLFISNVLETSRQNDWKTFMSTGKTKR